MRESMLKRSLGSATRLSEPVSNSTWHTGRRQNFELIPGRGIIHSEQLYEETGQGARAGAGGVANNVQAMRRGKMATTTNAEVHTVPINRREQHLITAPDELNDYPSPFGSAGLTLESCKASGAVNSAVG